MAPSSKENEVLTVAPDTASSTSVLPRAHLEDTTSRPQPVALEVPVTVNGARTVEGSDKREPFSEATKTVLVFGNGAVIRLGSPVSAGQLLFLTNEKTKKEVVCQVVKSKNYRNVSGYVELEFTESVVGFWGMRFPSDRIAARVPVPSASIPTPDRSTPAPSISAPPMGTSPTLSATSRIPNVNQAPVHADVRPVLPARPAEVKTAAPALSNLGARSIQTPTAPVTPVAKNPEIPAIPVPSLPVLPASAVVSLLGASEMRSSLTPSKQLAPPIPSETKPAAAGTAAENSSEELKLQTARLQEQLSSLLFSEAPTAKPAPTVPVLDSKAISGVAATVLEMAKREPALVRSAAPAKTPPPIKSSLDTEEVKIPSWLEPLARNAAAPAPTQEIVEREKIKHDAEIAAPDKDLAEAAHGAEMGRGSEIALPVFGSLLPLDEEAASHGRVSGGSRKGFWIGAIAAVLLAAGGAWYEFYPSNTVRSVTTMPVSPAPAIQTGAVAPEHTGSRPAEHPESRNAMTEPEATSDSTAAPHSNPPAFSAPVTRLPITSQPVPVTRDNMRGSATTIPAAVTERISRPTPEPEPKKPALGEVHLASPTMNRPGDAQDDQIVAPTISTSGANANSDEFTSGLAEGNGKQPAVPEVPLPVGGDVKPARLISKVALVYPILAKNQHVTGDVVIDAMVDANGHVTTMKVISGPTLLHQAAKDALRQWKYQPASLDGKPVAMHLTVTLQFRMQ